MFLLKKGGRPSARGGPAGVMSESKQLDRIRLNLLVDQFGATGGSGTFTTGFVRELLRDADSMQYIERLSLVASQGETLSALGALPPGVAAVAQRFPSRLRGTVLERFVGASAPRADVAHGMFYYVFPGQARHAVVTAHDLSLLHGVPSPRAPAPPARGTDGHSSALPRRCAQQRRDGRGVPAKVAGVRGHGVGGSILGRYGDGRGGSPPEKRSEVKGGRPLILVVGTLEPRKNYARVLDAFEHLLREAGERAPEMAIVGGAGVDERRGDREDGGAASLRAVPVGTGRRLRYARGLVPARDRLLVPLPLRGLRIPAVRGCPGRRADGALDASSVGEIWGGHARCVAPEDVGGIVTAWKWALALEGADRQLVVARQLRRRAREFTWSRCARKYVGLYRELAGGSR